MSQKNNSLSKSSATKDDGSQGSRRRFGEATRTRPQVTHFTRT
ncbi:uncharacterized protein G2W53_003327 [Senna tora]|uniref:Uncharacterized protein n=1 Tax=Senna tora TaxID=362788 RepID=A0A834X9Y0_9FABA|nr:uncharacterized protein G2W53_003327 [Senna tora]